MTPEERAAAVAEEITPRLEWGVSKAKIVETVASAIRAAVEEADARHYAIRSDSDAIGVLNNLAHALKVRGDSRIAGALHAAVWALIRRFGLDCDQHVFAEIPPEFVDHGDPMVAAVEEERAPLVALLASLEWAGHHHQDGGAQCPRCEGDQPLEGAARERQIAWAASSGRTPHLGGHEPGCELDAALRARVKP